MTQIKILDRTYKVPEQPHQIEALKEQIQHRSELVRLGHRPGKRERKVVGHETSFLFFKGKPIVEVVESPPEPLDEDERLRELEALVSNYDTMINHLKSSQRAYEGFFGELARGVQQAVEAGTSRVREMDGRRSALMAEALDSGNDALAGRASELEERLMRSVRVMAQATLLLLRKISLCAESLRALAEDQEAQKQVLKKLRGQIDLNRRLALLERDVAAFEKDVEAMARVSLQFEEYMRDFFGPLQSLLEQVAEVDERFHGTVQEIEDLTRVLLDEGKSGLELPESDDRFLDVLVKGVMDRGRLSDLLDSVEQHDGQLEAFEAELAVTEASVENALANVEGLVQVRLEPLLELAPESVAGGGRHVGGIEAHFVLIEPGTFMMGAGIDDAEAYKDERPQHKVTLSYRFLIQSTPVTQGQWKALMGHNPSRFVEESENCPVEQVSWWDVVLFCNKLSEQEGLEPFYILKEAKGMPGVDFECSDVEFRGLSCRGYRLPTEAEWEYAARAGTQSPRYGELDEIAWYDANSGGRTQPVGRKRANAWGLYDMLGNVWEWTNDWSGDYPSGPAKDPEGPSTGSSRVARGGGWGDYARGARAAYRYGNSPGDRYGYLGFRLARSNP